MIDFNYHKYMFEHSGTIEDINDIVNNFVKGNKDDLNKLAIMYVHIIDKNKLSMEHFEKFKNNIFSIRPFLDKEIGDQLVDKLKQNFVF